MGWGGGGGRGGGPQMDWVARGKGVESNVRQQSHF